MTRLIFGLAFLATTAWGATRVQSADTAIERGRYLVAVAGCSDCHTPGALLGRPDATRRLAGSDVGFAVPGLGVFPGRNLTPDPETGLGRWTEADIVAALTKGVRPDGRTLAPVMPWRALAGLTPADARSIAAYLKSLPPVHNPVPGPFGPTEVPDMPVSAVLPAAVWAGLRASPK